MRVVWRPLAPGETDHETLWASVAAALGVLSAAVWVLGAWPATVCAFRAMTGVPCPTCGATRLLAAVLAGDPWLALRMNPLLGCGAALVGGYLAYAAVVAVRRRPRLRVSLAPREAAWARAGALAAVLANWGFLILDGR